MTKITAVFIGLFYTLSAMFSCIPGAIWYKNERYAPKDAESIRLDIAFCENLYCVNIPSSVKSENGGLGMAIEVYPDSVLLRARNYITMEWPDEYSYTVNY